MFKIITEQEKNLHFKDVAENQFFVDCEGCFCQKISGDEYVSITDSKGKPDAHFWDEIELEMVVKKIYPKVLKIEF